MNPLMSAKEREVFKQILNRKSNQDYLEYGSGGSTVWACNNENINSVTSVEVAKDWIALILSQPLKITPVFFNPGYTYTGLTIGSDENERDKWELYSSGVNTLCDIVLIDGRFRVACASYAYDLLKENGVLLIHDYTPGRLEYRNIEKLYQIIETVETLVVAKKIPNLNNKIMWEKYKHSWI